jgi:hypothetical protein
MVEEAMDPPAALTLDTLQTFITEELRSISRLPPHEARSLLNLRFYAIGRAHNTLAPLNRLPDELLLRIFGHVASSEWGRHMCQPTVNLMKVCHQWWRICVGASSLWTTIYIDRPLSNAPMLLLSGNNEFALKNADMVPARLHDRQLETIAEHICRLVHVDVYLEDYSDVRSLAAVMRQADLLRLKSISVTCDRYPARDDSPHLEIEVDAPQLTLIVLDMVLGSFSKAIYERLQYLIMRGVFLNPLKMLPHCCNLRVLEIHCHMTFGDDSLLPYVKLPILESLNLRSWPEASMDVCTLLRALVVPMTCHLLLMNDPKLGHIQLRPQEVIPAGSSVRQILGNLRDFIVSYDGSMRICIEGWQEFEAGYTARQNLPEANVFIRQSFDPSDTAASEHFVQDVEGYLPLATVRRLTLIGWLGFGFMSASRWIQVFTRLTTLTILEVGDSYFKDKDAYEVPTETLADYGELLEALSTAQDPPNMTLCPQLKTLRIGIMGTSQRSAELLVTICAHCQSLGRPLINLSVTQRGGEKSRTLEAASALVSNFVYEIC